MNIEEKARDTFSPLREIDLSSADKLDILQNVREDLFTKRTKWKLNLGSKAISLGSAAVAIVVFGIVIYNVGHESFAVRSQARSTASNNVASNDTAKDYYLKTLGFQPMLPSYVPDNLKVTDSKVVFNHLTAKEKIPVFALRLVDKHNANAPANITVSEVSVTQYRQSVFGRPQQVVTRNGVKVNVYRTKNVTVCEFSKDGVVYMVESSGEYGTDELIKVLASLNVPDTVGPTVTTHQSKVKELG